MSVTINHQTNDISATSGSMTIDGAAIPSGGGGSGGGATGGGSDAIFYENGQNVTTDYTIPDGKNAMSAGPITLFMCAQ